MRKFDPLFFPAAELAKSAQDGGHQLGRGRKKTKVVLSADCAIESDTITRKNRGDMPLTGGQMPDQYSKLVGDTLKYPYLVGISTESGNLGTGILISARFVLTCGHVLHDSISAEVISQAGSTSARVQKMDDSLDLVLLELTRPISSPKAKFTDSPLQPGSILLAVGVQETPGKSDELSIAEIQLTYRNKNDADGKILDIQLEGGARPGYSGGPVVVQEGGALRCVGVMRFGGHGASSSNAIGLASIRAFVADYIPDLQEEKLRTIANGIRRILILTAILLAIFVVGTIAGLHYRASNSRKEIGGATTPATPGPEKTPSASPTSAEKPHASLQQGNPDVTVWVNTSSNLYHCPGTEWYGKTRHGEYMTQAEALKKANQPARGKMCK